VKRESTAAAGPLGQQAVQRRERRPVSMRGFALRRDGSSVEVVVLDLSYEGCGVETPVEFEPGEPLKLSVLSLGGIDTHVRWCRGNKAGLVFDSDGSAHKPHWPRRGERESLTAEVSLRRLGKLNYRVRVYDISPEGCKVELVDKPRLEEHVLVKFEALEALESEVCWIDGMAAGLRFEKPIHPAVFELLVERLKTAA
jgi:hypothetical protein